MMRDAKGQGVFPLGMCDDDVAFLLKHHSHPDRVVYHHFGFVIDALTIVEEFKDIVLAGRAHACWDGQEMEGHAVKFEQTVVYDDEIPDEIWGPTVTRLLYWSQHETPLTLLITDGVSYMYDEHQAAVVFPVAAHQDH